jgi:hypothetical protein
MCLYSIYKINCSVYIANINNYILYTSINNNIFLLTKTFFLFLNFNLCNILYYT